MTKITYSNQNEFYYLTQQDCSQLCKLQVPVAEDEFDRLQILRQTELLDSSISDPEFDRYTYLAKRLFKVPIALVSLVDVDRQWFKSRIGLDAQETHRNLAFCSYTVLPYSPEVFVVQNALKDDRFKNNELVTSHPHIRFYAGAALIVAGIRVGSLCIIDTVPREDFTLDDKATLLDLGHSVSSLIREKRERILYHQYTNSNLILNVRHNIRTPLMSAQVSCSLLQDDKVAIVNLIKGNTAQPSSSKSFGVTKTPSVATLASSGYTSGYNSANTSPGLGGVNQNQLIKNYTGSLEELDIALRKIHDFTESSIVFKEINLNPDLEYVKSAYNDLDSFSFSELNQQFNIHTLLKDINECFTTRSLNPNHVFLHQCETKWYVNHDNADENLCLNGDINNMKQAVVTVMNILSDSFVKLNVSLQYNLIDEDYDQSDIKYLNSKNKSSKETVFGNSRTASCSIESAAKSGSSKGGNNNVEFKGDFIVKVRVSEIAIQSINNQLSEFAASELCATSIKSTKVPSGNSLNNLLPTMLSMVPDITNATDKQKLDFIISHSIGKMERFLIPYDGRFKVCLLNEDLSVLEFIATFDLKAVVDKKINSAVKRVQSRDNDMEGMIVNEAKMDLIASARNDPDYHYCTGSSRSPSRLSQINGCMSNKIRDGLNPSRSSKALQELLISNESSSPSNAEHKNQRRASSNQHAQGDQDDTVAFDSEMAAADAKACLRSQTAGSYFSGIASGKQKFRVLVIEDSLSIQRVMKRLLESRGCEVHSAMNGKLGLECLMKDKFDLAFMDFLMPVMSGLEMLQECYELRTSPSSPSGKKLMICEAFDLNRNILICGMSATASAAEVVQAKKLGMHMYKQKPLDKRTIDCIIDSHKQLIDASVVRNIDIDTRVWAEKIEQQINQLTSSAASTS